MNDEPRPQIINLLESFNADIAMASKDGIRLDELMSIVGSITEVILKNINPIERRRCWDTLVKLMERRFERGDL
jgi:hypothetical protein